MKLRLAFAALSLALMSATVLAQSLTLTNPNWNITLTDAGYSDLLLDNTPGSVGREYLSGEWGAAVSYTVGSGGSAKHVSPTWLEPNFIFPDWKTNSDFQVVNPISSPQVNPGGIYTFATSTLANNDLRVDMVFEMLDTTFGMKIGTVPASAAAGSSIDSNRYVLKQTYTLKNISGEDITGLNMFQFLHALEGVRSLYDNRDYAGPQGTYRYDTTQMAVTLGTPFLDYISFGSSVAPVAFDNGRYGIESNPADDHAIGKPSVGVHLGVEADTLANVDNFAPTVYPIYWVGGAQKYSMGTLADGASVSIAVLLSVRTGTIVPDTGTGVGGSANGGSTYPGGVDFSMETVTEPGTFYAEYSVCDADELAERIAHGDFTRPTFYIPGNFQLFELEFEGQHDGDITLTFGYDDTILPPGFDEMTLGIWHFEDGIWKPLASLVDPNANTIQCKTSHLSPFGVGAVVPEPGSCLLAGLGVLHLLRRRR